MKENKNQPIKIYYAKKVVPFTSAQSDKLHKHCRQKGISANQVIRDLVASFLAKTEAKER